MDCLLGIDVGSTSMKALVYDLDGNVISRGSRPTESIANDPDHPNWQVYLPDHIWDGIASAIREAVSRLGRKIVSWQQPLQALARMQYPWMSTGRRFILLLTGSVHGPRRNSSDG